MKRSRERDGKERPERRSSVHNTFHNSGTIIMSYLKSLPEGSNLRDLFPRYPRHSRPLLEFHEELLRGDGALSPEQKELIAAYTSGLNACSYCYGIHTATAEAFGVEPGLLENLVNDLDSAPIDDAMRALLAYVRKVTQTPSRIVPADSEAVYAAGWSEDALFEAVATCATFNLMNRLVDGLGMEATAENKREAGQYLRDAGYAELIKTL